MFAYRQNKVYLELAIGFLCIQDFFTWLQERNGTVKSGIVGVSFLERICLPHQQHCLILRFILSS